MMSTKKYSHPAPLFLAIGSALAVSTTQAAVITVNTNADPGGSEVCSLRSAIEAVNNQSAFNGCPSPADGGLDTIQFDQSVTGSIELNDGMLEINNSVIISGPGADLLSINANGNSRVFATTPYAETISISGLTITGGGNVSLGGGVYADRSSHVTLSDCVITGNQATDYGGGVFQYASLLEIDNCTITNNSSGSHGGGVAVYMGAAEVRDSIITDNYADTMGGGLWVAGIYFEEGGDFRGRGGFPIGQAELLVESTTVSGNGALYGGGIAAGNLAPEEVVTQQGLFSLSSSSDQNDLPSGGLEPPVVPNLVVIDSEITDNYSNDGGGIGTFGYYVEDYLLLLGQLPDRIFGRYNLVEIHESSINANSAYGFGGGMFLKYSETLLYDTEVNGNSAAFGGGGIFNAGNQASGGGISASERGVFEGPVTYLGVVDSVIANNQLNGFSGRGMGPLVGAGIFNGLADAHVIDSEVYDNLGAEFGGGMAGLAGFSIIHESTISGNEGGGLSRTYGGVMGAFFSRIEENNDSGGMVCEGDGFCSAKYSSITNNQGDVVGGIANNMGLIGGGISSRSDSRSESRGGGAQSGQFYLANSTVSSNSGGTVGGIAGPYIELHHATVAMNQQTSTAQTVDADRGFPLVGGALLDDEFSLLNHSIVAGNSLNDGSADDLFVLGGGPIVMNYSLIQHDQGFTASGTGNILDQDPLLGPLDFNGSELSLTHALLEGSPAIDAGDPTLDSDLDQDQRGPGFPRIFNNVIDMGAFELTIDEIFIDRFESSP
jgi:hypothetical protein